MVENMYNDLLFINTLKDEEVIDLTQISLLSFTTKNELYKQTKLKLKEFINNREFRTRKELIRLLIAVNYRKEGQ